MRKQLFRLVLGLCAGVALVVAPAGSAGASAPSATGTGTATAGADQFGPLEYNRSIIRNVNNGRCLDSNWARQVYTLPCSGSFNPFQTWEIWNGGWTKNVATGYCLRAEVRGALDFGLVTADCAHVASHLWNHWNGGWYQSLLRDRPAGTNLCLVSDAHPLDRNPEYNPIHKCVWGDPPMHWRANYG